MNKACFVKHEKYFCENMASRRFQTLSDNSFAYMCQQCTSNNGMYDFHAALNRLKAHASSGKL